VAHSLAVGASAGLRSVVSTLTGLLRGRTGVVIILAVLAVVTNIAQFPGIERSTPQNVRAFYRPGTGDLLELMYRDCAGRCVQRYGLPMTLGLIAPGSRVLIPSPTEVLPDPDTADDFLSELRGFGAVARIEFVDAAVADTVLAAVDPTPFVVARGRGLGFGPAWAVAVSPDTATATGDPYDFLRRAVMSGPPAAPATPREFVVVRWVRDTLPGDTQADLALETSLLPAEVRAGLPR